MGHVVLKGLEHHAVFLLLLQLCILLAVARFLGEIMKRLRQPAVIGELTAGVLLGPSVFGLLYPQLQATVFPQIQQQADLLAVVAWIGVLFLLISTGLETDVRLILEKGRTALLISMGGIILPFASGLGLGYALPDRLLVNPELRLVFALFMAVAMSISAVPVIAKVLFDLKLVRRDVGQLTLAAAMTDDTIGWILLSVVAGLAARGSVDLRSIIVAVSAALLFLAISFTIGGRLVNWLVTATDRATSSGTAQLSLIIALALAAASFTHQMGIEAVLGAFVVGILVGQAKRLRAEVTHTLEMVTGGFLAPIFFASAGIKVDLLRLLDWEVFSVGLIVLAVACFGKFLGCYLGSWAGGLRHWERLAMGAGMNARGAMEIIVATVGLSLGVLTVEMYSVVVMVAIVTSLMAPPLLRWTLSHVQIGEAEMNRLAREAEAGTSFVRSIRRVLLVARDKQQATLASRVVESLARAQPTEATAFYVNLDEAAVSWWKIWADRLAWQAFRRAKREIRQVIRHVPGAGADLKVATGPDAVEKVLKEAASGYDLIIMAVGSKRRSTELLFGRVVDRVLREAPCPTLVLRGTQEETGSEPVFSKILVPTVGTEYSKNAVEAASMLAQASNGKLTIVHVVSSSGTLPAVHTGTIDRARELGEEIVANQAEIARKLGADVEARTIDGTSPESAILELVRSEQMDLVVMGTSLRAVNKRAFIGHRAETVLQLAPCVVAVVSTQ